MLTVSKRYFYTIKHLKLKQLLFQIIYRFGKSKQAELGKINVTGRQATWYSPAYMESSISSDGVFLFLNQKECHTETSDIWNSTKHTKLWQYNLHYFDCLNSEDAKFKQPIFSKYIERWIDENPFMQGSGWEPYPISLRIVNWVKWYLKYPHLLGEAQLKSIAVQASVLNQRPEYHILANHLFANAKALVFAGAFLKGNEATVWLKKGVAILDAEINEQFLFDGGHFELTPMYHAILLWDVCDIYNLANCVGVQALKQRQGVMRGIITSGFQWLQKMCHPDGDIAFFNDATFGIAPSLEKLKEYISYLGITLPRVADKAMTHFSDSGFVVIEGRSQTKLILDVGRVGANYQPGHAHADTLSFELSLFRQRFIVNSGISTYEKDNLRQYQRSTGAHSTVCVDGRNSSDVWSGFRVGKRARPKNLKIDERDQKVYIQCSHDGYRRIKRNATHSRCWIMTQDSLSIEDHIQGSFASAEIRFFLHPSIKILSHEVKKVRCLLPTGEIVNVSTSLPVKVIDTYWYPGFNMSQSNKCIIVMLQENAAITHIEWNAC